MIYYVSFILWEKLMEKRQPNYHGMFLIGISLIAIGTTLISLEPKLPVGVVFISVGGLFLIVSIKNKDKWRFEKNLKKVNSK